MNQYAASVHDLRLVAGRPALNFANTVDPRQGNEAIDYLKTYTDLTVWARRAGLLHQATAARLVGLARQDSAKAMRALESARVLREVIFRIFSTLAVRQNPSPADLARLRRAFHEVIGHARLEKQGRAFRWQLDDDLESISWQVTRDAVALLESDLLGRVKQCPGSDDCGWLFLDSSRNSARRWCSMQGCGNRVKARRHARRAYQH